MGENQSRTRKQTVRIQDGNEVDEEYQCNGAILVPQKGSTVEHKKLRPAIIPYVNISGEERKTISQLVSPGFEQEFKEYIQKNYYAIFYEIREWGTYWLMVHDLAEKDSAENLCEMLTKVHAKSADDYRKLVNVQNMNGDTPLMVAVRAKALSSMQLLLSFGGIDLNLRNDAGESAEDLAKLEGFEQTVAVLKDKRYANCHQISNSFEVHKQALGARKVEKRLSGNSTENKVFHAKGNVISKELLQQIPNEIFNPDYKAQIDEIIKLGEFYKDSSFKADNQTLSDSFDKSPLVSTTIWLRPYQIFHRTYKLFDGIDPQDIIEGQTRTCFHLAVFSSMAQYPKHIERLFKNGLNIYGFYILSFYTDGLPVDVVIDDLIPCSSSKRQPIFCKPRMNAQTGISEIWAVLLEKAWIKQFQYYSRVHAVTPDNIFEDLMGVPSYGWSIVTNHQRDLAAVAQTTFKRLQSARQNKYPAVAVVKRSVTDKPSIKPSHQYSILALFSDANLKLIKIRNAKIGEEWSGQYGDNSPNMTAELKSRLNYRSSNNDGIFWVTLQEFVDIFGYYAIAYYRENYFYKYVKFNSNLNQNVYYMMEFTKRQSINVRVIQPYSKYKEDKNYEYSPMVLNVIKIGDSGDRNQLEDKVIAVGCKRHTKGHKSIHWSSDIFQEIQPGKYLVQIKCKWISPESYNSAVLSVYCEQDIQELKEVPRKEGDWHLARAYQAEIEKMPSLKEWRVLRQGTLYKALFNKITTIILYRSRSNETAEIVFKKKEMKNCELDLGKSKNDAYVLEIKPNEIGTVEAVTLAQEHDCGIPTEL